MVFEEIERDHDEAIGWELNNRMKTMIKDSRMLVTGIVSLTYDHGSYNSACSDAIITLCDKHTVAKKRGHSV